MNKWLILFCLVLSSPLFAEVEVIEGNFTTTASTSVVMGVLTDYNHLADFVPSLLESNVVGKDETYTYVKQVGKASFLSFSKEITVILEVEEGTNALHFIDIHKTDFKFYNGYWYVSNGKVYYLLQCEKNFKAPKFISKHVMKKTVKQLLQAVKDEIERRQARG
jgi:hypothetical protein